MSEMKDDHQVTNNSMWWRPRDATVATSNSIVRSRSCPVTSTANPLLSLQSTYNVVRVPNLYFFTIQLGNLTSYNVTIFTFHSRSRRLPTGRGQEVDSVRFRGHRGRAPEQPAGHRQPGGPGVFIPCYFSVIKHIKTSSYFVNINHIWN